MRITQLRGRDDNVKKATVNRGLFPGAEFTDCRLKKFFFKSQAHCAKLKIPIRVVYGFRSFEEQERLFRLGKSQKRGGKSAHNSGMAIDIIHMERAWSDMPFDGWKLLASILFEQAHSMDLNLRWGGDWNQNGVAVIDDPAENFWDAAHWEIAGWQDEVLQACGDCTGQCLPAWEIDMPRSPGPKTWWRSLF